MRVKTYEGDLPILKEVGKRGLLTRAQAESAGALLVPDFTMYTGAMTAPEDEPGIVRMIGSSTDRDLQGDTMALSALADMAQAPVGLTIWLNHTYELPGSIFGSLLEQPKLVQQGTLADLHIASDVEKDNPAAAQTYKYIQNKRRLGCSVGAMVLEYEIDEENDNGDSWWPPIIILRVLPLEWSVCGIPANQRSWVENAIKGLFARTFDRRLASAVKGMYPRQYGDLIAPCPSAALRRDLEKVAARPTDPRRVEWVPLSKTFVLNVRGKIAEIEPGEIETMVSSVPAPRKSFLDEIDETLAEDDCGVPLFEQVDEAALCAAIEKEMQTPSRLILAGDDRHAEVVPASVEKSDDGEKTVEPQQEEDITMPDKQKSVAEQVAEALLAQYNVLGNALGLPPVARDGDGSYHFSSAAPAQIDDVIEQVIFRMFAIEKAGAEFSQENMGHLCALHKTLRKMTDGKICDMDSEDDDDNADPDGEGDNDDSDEEGQPAQPMNRTARRTSRHVAPVLESFHLEGIEGAVRDAVEGQLGEITRALAGLNVKGIEASVATAQNTLLALKRQIAEARGELAATAEQAAKLLDMPLGRPTAFTQRTVHPGDNSASYNDFLAISAFTPSKKQEWTLSQALAACRFEDIEADGYSVKYRVWGEGVGGSVKDGVRPGLSGAEKSLMRPEWIIAYNEGGEARVPLVNFAEISEASTTQAQGSEA